MNNTELLSRYFGKNQTYSRHYIYMLKKHLKSLQELSLEGTTLGIRDAREQNEMY